MQGTDGYETFESVPSHTIAESSVYCGDNEMQCDCFAAASVSYVVNSQLARGAISFI